MPRNGSGTMSISNSFSSGTTISSSAMNANFTDVASEITGSLPRDGQAAMTGQLKSASGSVSAPGLTFSADPDTGFYRSAADSIGVASGGANVATFDSSGLTVDAVTLDNTGLHILDSDGTHDLIIKPGSNLTADRTLTVTTGDADRGFTLSGDLTVSASSTLSGNVTVASGKTFTASNTVTFAGTDGTTLTLPGSTTTLYGQADNASQSDMETGTSTTKVVVPGVQRYHPMHPKAWAYVSVSGTTPTLTASSGISGVARDSQGRFTVTFSTAFSSANFCVLATAARTDGVLVLSNIARTTTTAQVLIQALDGTSTDASYHIMVLGDQ